MAYKPSLRQSSDDQEMALDIRPVMNLMVVLIPLLIAGAEWVKLSIIEINVPPAQAGGPGAGEDQNELKEKAKKLGLTVAVSAEGLTIGNAGMILSSDEGEAGPTVQKLEDGTYDYAKFKEKLIEIKKKVLGKGFIDENRAVITASADIEYQAIITIMDNLQTYTSDTGETLPLFPEINFSKVM